MYLKSVTIENIKSTEKFEMRFDKPAGWHVIIGENGAGKSSIVKAIALALIGPYEAKVLRLPLLKWIRRGQDNADVSLEIEAHDYIDAAAGVNTVYGNNNIVKVGIRIPSEANKSNSFSYIIPLEGDAFDNQNAQPIPQDTLWSRHMNDGWFSASFGPFRRFRPGSSSELASLNEIAPLAAPHMSLFGEDLPMMDALKWLQELDYSTYKEKQSDGLTKLVAIQRLLNDGGLLPDGVVFESISANGIIIKDKKGFSVDVTEMSDGYRSILSLIFELLRQIDYSTSKDIFTPIIEGKIYIDIPGVVLIDEVDAHLHPTWQTSIGRWFTKYFPKMQFIVTTHSPLVCRACENGTIWYLPNSKSEKEAGEITGTDKERLVFGNILDAYGTEVFGASPVRSERFDEKKDRLGSLNIKAVMKGLSNEEEEERKHLRIRLSTDDPFGPTTA